MDSEKYEGQVTLGLAGATVLAVVVGLLFLIFATLQSILTSVQAIQAAIT